MKVSAGYRTLFVAGLTVGSIWLSGCMTDSDSSSDGKVKITDLKVTPSSVKAGDSVEVDGTASADGGLTGVNVTIWKGDTNFTTGHGFEVVETPYAGTAKAWNLQSDGKIKIAVKPTALLGTYKVKASARAGTDSAVATVSLEVAGTAVTTQEFLLGANQNATGGSVDLDEMKVYTHAEAKPISGKIDLYYAHAATGEDKLFTPLQAKSSGFGEASNGPATWTTANATEFRKITLTDSAFAQVATQQVIDDLWTTGVTVVGGGDEVAVGSTYVVNTDMAKKVLIRVTAHVAGDAGTITVKGTK